MIGAFGTATGGEEVERGEGEGEQEDDDEEEDGFVFASILLLDLDAIELEAWKHMLSGGGGTVPGTGRGGKEEGGMFGYGTLRLEFGVGD